MTHVQRLYFRRHARKYRVTGFCWVNGKCRISPQSTCRYSPGKPSKRIGTSATACSCSPFKRSRRTAARHTEPQPPYGWSGSSRASSIIRTPLSPCCSHSPICSRNTSTLDFRRRPDGCRSTGSLSARATVFLLRPSSLAIWRRLFPRLCSKWTVLRSMRRNTLLPALLGWATVSGYDADPLSHFAVKAVSGSGRRFSSDGVPKALQTPDQTTLGLFTVMLVEVLRPEVLVVAVTGEQVVDDRQQRVRQRDDCLLFASPRRHSVVVGRQIGVFAATGRVRRFDQRRPEPDVPLARLATHAFTSALIVAWTQAPHEASCLYDGKRLRS